jgi:hypothetical protein
METGIGIDMDRQYPCVPRSFLVTTPAVLDEIIDETLNIDTPL